MTPTDVLRTNLRAWRAATRCSHSELVTRLAELGWTVDRTALVRIESGSRGVSLDEAHLIARVLDAPLSTLTVQGATFQTRGSWEVPAGV